MLIDAFKAGVAEAQLKMSAIPSGFKAVLEQNEAWCEPFAFTYPDVVLADTVPSYDKIELPLKLSNANVLIGEDAKEGTSISALTELNNQCMTTTDKPKFIL